MATLGRFRMRLHTAGLGAIALGALVLAACSTTASPAAPSGTSPSGSATVTVATAPGGQKYLADGAGRALYLFVIDSFGKSNCNGACAVAWPPLTGAATAGAGVTGSLASITRSDGSSQAVYAGHPLYYFQQDTGAGQTNGEGVNGFGGLWYLLDPSGKPITSLSSSGGSQGGYGN